jgi:hypothetical protein
MDGALMKYSKSHIIFSIAVTLACHAHAVPPRATQCAQIFSSPKNALIESVAVRYQLGDLYSASAQVRENQTIAEHTQNVLEVFSHQVKFFPQIKRLHLLELILTLHDIGKPIAIQAGNKARQHEFTLPILLEILEHNGYQVRDQLIAKALVESHTLSNLSRGSLTVQQAVSTFESQARFLAISPVELFEMQWVYFVSDVGAYTNGSAALFQKTHLGQLIPNDDHEALANILQQLSNIELASQKSGLKVMQR